MKSFNYYKPQNLDEAVKLMDEYKDSVKPLLGGTDLHLMIREGMIQVDNVIDLKGVTNLDKFFIKDGYLYIGASVTFTRLIESDVIKEKFPVLWETSKKIASMGIRNRATLIGNICSSVPSADSAPALMNRDATVHIKSVEGEREVNINEFFTGPRKNVLKENEIVTHIKIPVIEKRFAGAYVKMGRYKGEDLAQVGLGILVTEDYEYSISYCAVSPTPVRIKKAEEILKGKENITDELMNELKPVILESISPISDIRASKEYREKMSVVLLERGLRATLSRLKNSTPPYGEGIL